MNGQPEKSLPIPPLAVAAIGGLLSVVIVYPINSVTIRALSSVVALPVTVPTEELAKVIGVLFLCLYYPRSVIGKVDALKLGALAGLVFGLIETAISKSGALGLVFATTVHVLCSGVASMGIVRAAARRATGEAGAASLLGWPRVSFFVLAVAMHLAYNFLAVSLKEIGLIAGIGCVIAAYVIMLKHSPGDIGEAAGLTAFQILLRPSQGGAAVPTTAGPDAAAEPPAVAGAPAARIFCTECGVENTRGSAFCHNCGKPLAGGGG